MILKLMMVYQVIKVVFIVGFVEQCRVLVLCVLMFLFFFCFFCVFIFLFIESDDLDMNRLATAPRPGTTLRPETISKNPQQQLASSRPRTLSGRPLTGMVSE